MHFRCGDVAYEDKAIADKLCIYREGCTYLRTNILKSLFSAVVFFICQSSTVCVCQRVIKIFVLFQMDCLIILHYCPIHLLIIIWIIPETNCQSLPHLIRSSFYRYIVEFEIRLTFLRLNSFFILKDCMVSNFSNFIFYIICLTFY